jgi:hypothetical protein
LKGGGFQNWGNLLVSGLGGKDGADKIPLGVRKYGRKEKFDRTRQSLRRVQGSREPKGEPLLIALGPWDEKGKGTRSQN